MSLRTPFTAIRHLSTSVRVSRPAAALEETTRPSGFGAIRDILSAPSTSTSQSSIPPSSLSTIGSGPAPARGYGVDAIPPKVDPSLDLFTNCLMKDGKKSEAQKMVSSILTLLQQTTNLPPQPLLRQAILLSSPSIKVLSMRKSAKTILTPRAMTERQRTRQGVAWILKAAEKGRKGGVSRDQRIAREILAVLEGQSDVYKWVEERHKVAYLNRSNMTAR
ncbi:hypothetical protein CI109_101009 [Kwoniella shandongensis]|uniref:Small ribosomal subunit protein uS7 domain-containing protein n=1 Tax=Kwoniella shandongensis TaxID=1734106 RepID=A0A5M6C4Q5_9TREE|nr:uncharacterized protein CI109_001478 [Kwoniella shandongensis]KAA5530074.1 hypothetical protein CI109_001478 [Kwoniella shandongensis]